MRLSGAEILIQSLTEHRVDTIFGYPGSCVMQVLDYLYDNKEIRHILVRHEQGAVHAAAGYAQVSNKPGVVLVTSGPGATNTVSGIADAFASGTPIIVITGQVSSHLLGTDAFQEANMITITAPITKWNYQIQKADQIADAVAKAFSIATSDRPGPVLLDITKDAQTEIIETLPDNIIEAEIITALKDSGKDIVLVVDKVPNDFYSHDFFGSNKIIKSGALNVAGFGLPAAIGASFAIRNKTICLIVGTREFQATIEELAVIKQQGLNIKIIVLKSGNEMKNPDFIKLISAYGIECAKSNDTRSSINRMLDSEGSYILEII